MTASSRLLLSDRAMEGTEATIEGEQLFSQHLKAIKRVSLSCKGTFLQSISCLRVNGRVVPRIHHTR